MPETFVIAAVVFVICAIIFYSIYLNYLVWKHEKEIDEIKERLKKLGESSH